MGHGGKRPGAGRKPGSTGKKKRVRSARLLAGGDHPLDIMLLAARKLYAAGDFEAAANAAAKAAPYIHQKFAATQQPAEPHKYQRVAGQGELFPPPPPPGEAEPEDTWDKVLN